MSEENKDAAKPVEAPSGVEAPKTETPKQDAVKAEAPKIEEPKQETPKTDASKPEGAAKEKPVNCTACKKSIKKKRYYYRNGKYYCTQRCFKTTVKKASQEAKDLPAETETKQ